MQDGHSTQTHREAEGRLAFVTDSTENNVHKCGLRVSEVSPGDRGRHFKRQHCAASKRQTSTPDPRHPIQIYIVSVQMVCTHVEVDSPVSMESTSMLVCS